MELALRISPQRSGSPLFGDAAQVLSLMHGDNKVLSALRIEKNRGGHKVRQDENGFEFRAAWAFSSEHDVFEATTSSAYFGEFEPFLANPEGYQDFPGLISLSGLLAPLSSSFQGRPWPDQPGQRPSHTSIVRASQAPHW